MDLDEPRVITSRITPQTDQQASNFRRLFSFVEQFFLKGLQMTLYQANYQFMVLITLLTGEWGLSLFLSVVITNVFEGARLVLVVLTTWLADTYLDYRLILLNSALSYCFGLALWCFTIPNFRWEFFLPGLLLILGGQCGHGGYMNCRDQQNRVQGRQLENNNGNERRGESASLNQNNGQDQGLELEEVNNNQEPRRDEEHDGQQRDMDPLFLSHDGNSEHISLRIRITRSALVIKHITNWAYILTALIIAIFFFPYGKGGFIILIVMFLVNFIILSLMRMLCHNYSSSEEVEGNPLSIIFKVIFLAFTKSNDDIHGNLICTGDFNAPNRQLHGNIRFLDRAALYNPSNVNPSVEFEQGRLCTIQQVEDTNCFINAMLLSLSFLMYGVMTAVGDTFFVEQADEMDSHIGNYKVPIQLFVMTSDLVRKIVSYICKKLIANRVQESSRRRFYGALRVGIGMLLSVPCFTIALFIENKRLKALKADVNISAFWLTPQLILVGLMDGLAVDGVKCFFEHEMPNSIGVTYGGILSNAIVGLGKLLGVGWFCFWFFITKIGDNSGWFGYEIDSSRLDYYYAVMVGFGLVSTLVYACVVTKHSYSQQSLHN